MQTLCIALSVLSLLSTLILSSLLWWGFREARAIGAILHNRELLPRYVTQDVLKTPFGDAARYDSPVAGSYASTMRLFLQAHETGHAQARTKVRSVLFCVIVGSGVVGFLAIGWLGVALPLVNFLVVYVMWVRSKHGSIGEGAGARAAEYVRIVALILCRWHDETPTEAEDWAEKEPGMHLLWQHLSDLYGWKQRAPETRINEQGRSSNPDAADSSADEDDSASEDWVERRIHELTERCRLPMSDTEKDAMREELSSLKHVIDVRAAQREGKIEELRVVMEKELRELDTSGTGQTAFPAFREWFALPANSGLEETTALEDYLGELNKWHDERIAIMWFNEEKRRLYEERTGTHDDSINPEAGGLP